MNDNMVQKEYERDEKLKAEDVKKILDWAQTQLHLPEMSEQEVIWFLKSCYYSNEAAKKAIDNYFTMKTMSPEVLRNREVTNKNIIDAMEVVVFSALPQKNPEGFNIIMSHWHDLNPDIFVYNDCMRIYDMIVIADLLKNGTNEGIRFCFDMKGVTFSHLTKIGLISMKKFLYYLQDAMPVRLKGLHFFNINPVVDKLVTLMKPFLKKEIIEVLYLHENVEDLSKYVPLECLPIDYGGKQDSTAILYERMKEILKENAEFFAHQEKQLVDEQKRAGKPKNISDIYGVEGTFKKLDLD